MSRLISKAEGFEVAYKAFQNINFNAFDYYSIKQSMIEYVRLYHSETMNDFIESSEFIALIEVFAYLGELMAYRFDMNANEMAIQYSTRKQSILRLAKLVSYNSSRNIPARGLVKITSISTSEHIFDSFGNDLSNKKIVWNDQSNTIWKDQFFRVLDSIMQQKFGTVAPNERKQIDDQLFELYPLNNLPLSNGVIKYTAQSSTTSYPMELVSCTLTEIGPIENRPIPSAPFNILYATDGLGDASNFTGFFVYTKQGTLHRRSVVLDGALPNQTYDIKVDNINNTDLWVTQIDPNTQLVYDLGDQKIPYGLWTQVDTSNAQNIIFNTNESRNKYEVETLENDQVRLIFGDGEFADTPAGSFEFWYRTSANELLYLPKTSVTNKIGTFAYKDKYDRTQNISFTFSLQNALQNASPSEDIEHIRKNAPQTYYSQDRMVNNKDYNVYPKKDVSILKLRSINRTFVGDSTYEMKSDASHTYQNVRMIGDDLTIFFKQSYNTTVAPGSIFHNVLLTNYVQPILSSVDRYIDSMVEYETFRRIFSPTEISNIIAAMDSSSYPWPISIKFRGDLINSDVGYSGVFEVTSNEVGNDWDIYISKTDDQSQYVITYYGQRIVAESNTVKFYHDNHSKKVLSLDTLTNNKDSIVVLQANTAPNRTKLLSHDINFSIVDNEWYEVGSGTIGLPNLHQLAIYPPTEADGTPKDLLQTNIIGTTTVVTMDPVTFAAGHLKIVTPIDFIVGYGDVKIETADGAIEWCEAGLRIHSCVALTNSVRIVGNVAHKIAANGLIKISNCAANDGVYRIKTVTPTILGYTTIMIYDDIVEADIFGDSPNLSTSIVEDSTNVGYVSVYGSISNEIIVIDPLDNLGNDIAVQVNEYVYFSRDAIVDSFTTEPLTPLIMAKYVSNRTHDLIMRRPGRQGLNFVWKHYAKSFELIDPAITNIIDMFIITSSYYIELQRWLTGLNATEPELPTSNELRNSYLTLLNNKMISDSVILHPGRIKILIGAKAQPELRAKIKIVKSSNATLTNNQIKIKVANLVREFFNIDGWEFGETFYYTELDTFIQNGLPGDIASTVLVPISDLRLFGDLYQIMAREDEIFQVDIQVGDIEIVEALTSLNLKQLR